MIIKDMEECVLQVSGKMCATKAIEMSQLIFKPFECAIGEWEELEAIKVWFKNSKQTLVGKRRTSAKMCMPNSIVSTPKYMGNDARKKNTHTHTEWKRQPKKFYLDYDLNDFFYIYSSNLTYSTFAPCR